MCQHCGASSSKWFGHCPDCDSWNSFVEEKIDVSANDNGRSLTSSTKAHPQLYREVQTNEELCVKSGLPEFDLVLGGGIVSGSLVLIGGDPGIGKSTLLLQIAAQYPGPVVYVSGEESERQIKLRGERLGIDASSLLLYSETQLEQIIKELKSTSPALVVLDSVQTIFSSKFSSAPGLSLIHISEPTRPY